MSSRHLVPRRAAKATHRPEPRRRVHLKSRARQRACNARETSCQVCQDKPWNPVSLSPNDLWAADEPEEPTPHAEVVVKGRNVEIPDHFRIYVSQKLARLERFDRTVYLFDVELDHEPNRRQRKSCQHVEITARGRGPVVRGEARDNSSMPRSKPRSTSWKAGRAASRSPQSPLWRQDARLVGRGDRRRAAPNRPSPPRPHPTTTAARQKTGSTSRAGWCAPRNTRPDRCR